MLNKNASVEIAVENNSIEITSYEINQAFDRSLGYAIVATLLVPCLLTLFALSIYWAEIGEILNVKF